MLNTLSNHGFLPHSGRNILKEATVNALFNALNVDEEFSTTLFLAAILTSPEPSSTTYSLNDLGRHNLQEHDASLRYGVHTRWPGIVN